MSDRAAIRICAALTLVFACFALHRIARQGLLYHDAGGYLLEGRFLAESARLLATRPLAELRAPGFFAAAREQTIGVPLHFGKPGLSLILALAGTVLGFHDTLSAEVTAACAVLGLLLVQLIAWRLDGPLAAVYAVALVASSSFYLVYARAALADMVVAVFFLAGLALHLHRAGHGARFLAGVLFGYAFACNQWRVSYILPLLLLCQAHDARAGGRSWRSFAGGAALTTGGFALVPLLFQLPYTVLAWAIGPLPFPDYRAQLQERISTQHGLTWFHQPAELARVFWRIEGPVLPGLVAAAWALLAARLLGRRQRRDVVLFLFGPVPFLYFSCLKWGLNSLPRTVAIVIPIAAIAAGILLASLHRSLASRGGLLGGRSLALAALVSGLLVLAAAPRLRHVAAARSGYAEASRYLALTGERRFFMLANEPIWRFHLGRVAHDPYRRPRDLAELVATGAGAGIETLVVDHATIYSRHGAGYAGLLVDRIPALRTFANPRGRSLPYLIDEFGLATSERMAADPRCGTIYVYRVRDVAEALADGRLEATDR